MRLTLLTIVASLAATSAWGDQSAENVGPKSFYTIAAGTCTGCKPRSFSSTHHHWGLSDAVGTVTFSVRSWGNFNNSAYVHVTVGGTAITSSNATCSPSNCHFFENGSDSGYGPAPNNSGSFTVSDTFFNNKLNGGSTLTVVHTIVGQNTCISTVNSPCSTPNSDGDQTSVIVWTPGASCSPPCTNTACQYRQCQSGACVVTGNKPSGTPCGSSSNTECTDPDTCNGAGSCQSNHEPSGTACGSSSNTECTDPDTCSGSGFCQSNHEPGGTSCSDGEACTGQETCNGGGACQTTFIANCNENNREDICDIAEGTSLDCNANGILDECGEGNPPAVLTHSVFDCDDSLPRTQKHVLRFTFACPITLPPTGQPVEIRALLGGGGVGPDLSASFSYTVEDGNVLRIKEEGDMLSNETWYGIMNTGGWSTVAIFERDYVVVYGDANGNLETDVIDAAAILAERVDPAPDDTRYDIDGNGAVDVVDAALALALSGSTAPTKPTGHGCTAP